MPEDRADRPSDPFAAVRTHLAAMSASVAGPSVDMLALAKAYAALASAMVQATRAVGQTSMRFEVVAKALDLRTPKSQLERFLDTRE